MIEILAAAAEAAERYEAERFDPSLMAMGSAITLYAVLPLAAGVIYARHWRAILIWVAILGTMSCLFTAGQILISHYRYTSDILRVLLDVATLTLAPPLFFAVLGAVIRKTWDRRAARRAAHKVQS